ncbi:MAG: FIST C-terminal domain-containing protein [Gammaproteobacteria bacterium]|nr:FIST C-terminal domain-containing protein [Gammaproteobacteria bacterium]
MKVEQSIFDTDGGWRTLPDSDAVNEPQLVLHFGAKELLATPYYYDILRNSYPKAHIVGCSTAGEIIDRDVHDNTAVACAVEFDSTRVRVSSRRMEQVVDSFYAGVELGSELAEEDLRCVMVISDGIQVNGSELVRGLTSAVGGDIPVTGGLAGDADRFESTLVSCNAPAEAGCVAAIGLYGSSVSVGHGSVGGWDAFGPERTITKSEGNVLFELDGKPALDLYKRYLGDEAANLPGSALLFPLMVRAENSDEIGLVRTVLGIDEAQKSMTFAGDLPQGHKAQLMRANFERLIDGAGEAARIAGARGLTGRKLAVLISCVGRKMVLGQRTSEEVEAVAELLGQQVCQFGYYSYGEISPHVRLGSCELHNQTMTITVLAEDAD